MLRLNVHDFLPFGFGFDFPLGILKVKRTLLGFFGLRPIVEAQLPPFEPRFQYCTVFLWKHTPGG